MIFEVLNFKTIGTMELEGKVIDILPLESGTGRNGEWKKQNVIIETKDQYPKKVCATIWGDKIDSFNLQKNEEVTAKINIESREYNGKWYTDVKVWSVSRNSGAGSPAPAQSGGMPDMPPPPTCADAPPPSDDDMDDLPF
jgi:hypothetical protein